MLLKGTFAQCIQHFYDVIEKWLKLLNKTIYWRFKQLKVDNIFIIVW